MTPSSTVTARSRNYRDRSSLRSSVRSLALAAAIAVNLTSVTPALAQDPAKPSPDSLAARLERAEEEIALLRQQLADQSQTAVQARSKVTFELNGRVLMNAFSNSRSVNNVDVPLYVRPDSATGLPQGGVGVGVRQTTLGFTLTAPNVFGAVFSGDMEVDFFGGQYDASTTPLVRLRTARAWLRWKNAELMMGQDAPLMSPLNPLSLAAVGVPGFSSAGNLWAWLPQVRVGVETSGHVKFGVQGAVLAPTGGSPSDASSLEPDIAQRSKRPFVETRAHVRWGADDLAADVGLSTHAGWFATPNSTSLRQSSGMGADAMVPLAKWIELRGEWYSGDGMQGLGGGAIGQLFDSNFRPIHSTGMWGQLNIKPSNRVTVGGGFGSDDPDDKDLPADARLKNVVNEVHLQLRPAGPIVVGFEYRRIETTYATGKFASDHFNLAVGFVF